jgi:predicted N-acetyltransferase YhbS
MLNAVIRGLREENVRLCMLFSDIGTAYYEQFGFVPLPAEEQWGRIPQSRKGPPVGWELREMTAGDLVEVRGIHHAAAERRPLAVVRDAEHWSFLQSRTSSFFERLQDREISAHSRVAVVEGAVVGYVISIEGRGEWNVREIEATGEGPGNLERLFRTAAWQARRNGLRRFYGWLPGELVRSLPDWKMRRQPRRRAIPMVLPLDPTIDLAATRDPRSSFIPYQDQF